MGVLFLIEVERIVYVGNLFVIVGYIVVINFIDGLKCVEVNE